jgi:hypothetical protein
MNKNKIILLVISSGIWIGAQLSVAATIPAGTTLQVRTSTTISSRDTAGKKFQGQLLQDVGAKGTVILPAGTPVVGVVESPRVEVGSSTRPLTLKLTQVSVHGRTVSIKTQGFEAENLSPWKGRRGRVQISGGAFVLPHGTTLQFRLAQPLTL